YKLIRFNANETIAEWLDTISDIAHDYDVKHGEERRILFDVFSEPSKIQAHADVLVAPDFFETFLLMLKKQGVYEVTVLKKNVQKLIDEEWYVIDNRQRRRKRAGNVLEDFDDETYHEYDRMVRFMHELERHHPSLVKVVNVSRSTENRQIVGVKISTSSAYKPAIVIDAGVHAREWVAPAAAMYIIKKMVKSYGHDTRLTRAMHDFDWFIVPQVNPDGYEYSRNTDRLWRKTRSRFNGSRYCLGTDANRNWGFKWGEAGANRSPCSNIYQGAHPFSEPEIAGLKNFLTFEIPDLTIYISLHSYGQQEAANKAVGAIRRTSGSNYTYGTIAEVMYPASGTSIDYLQDKGIPYIYGVELRPADTTDSYGFNIPAKFIKPTGDEMLEGVLALAEHAMLKKKIR
ncbi:hypothetical protein PFISCL1PPCAC_5010, partial [Pristionchus fissidentatus]